MILSTEYFSSIAASLVIAATFLGDFLRHGGVGEGVDDEAYADENEGDAEQLAHIE